VRCTSNQKVFGARGGGSRKSSKSRGRRNKELAFKRKGRTPKIKKGKNKKGDLDSEGEA